MTITQFIKEAGVEQDKKWYLWNKEQGENPESFTTCGEEVKDFYTQKLQQMAEVASDEIINL